MKIKHSAIAATAAGLALALGAGVLPASAGSTAWGYGALSCSGSLLVALSASTTYTASYYRNNILNATYNDGGTYVYHRNLKYSSISTATITSVGTLPKISGATANCAFS